MRPKDVDQKKKPEPKGALPGTLLRVCWLARVTSPTVIAAPLLWCIFASITPEDFAPWLRIPWSTVLDAEGIKKLDVDLLAENLITPNAVTKTLTATTIVLFTLYVTDLRTTGRRQGWHLIGHPMNPSRLREFFVWLLLFVLFTIIIGSVTALRVNTLCTPHTALEFTLIAEVVAMFALVLTNRNFNAYLLLVPTLEAKRKQLRAERIARAKERQRERQAKQLEAKRERDRIRAQRARIVELQEACREIDAEVAYLESSDQPRNLIDEELAALHLKRSELEDEIDRLSIDLS